MSPDTKYEDLDPTAVEIIRRKACRLIGRVGFTGTDREDLEQELTLAVLRALPHFDPQRACLRTFLSRVVDNAAAKIVRHRMAAKRDFRRLAQPRGKPAHDQTALDASCRDDTDWGACADLYGSRAHDLSAPRALGVDVRRAVGRLPDKHRALCERIPYEGPTEIARELGVSRFTVYYWINQIRSQFQACGLQAYV